ncbi:MAG: DUF1566 domain-containing protein [Deltaproteobacteria bacterium]|nr:DUF1566 domain-containing protein [Deltaproteobacteria bacterium]
MMSGAAKACGLPVALVCVVLLGACDPEAPGKSGDAGSGADASATLDTNSVDTGGDPGDSGSGPKPGGIDWPCTTPNDCDEPLCLATPEGKRCSTYCGDAACPDGWSCAGQLKGGDATTFCVPTHGLVCRPCNDDATCQASGVSGSRCVPYGDDGGFCGAPCSKHTDCPTGLACRSVVSVTGASSKQCVVPGKTTNTFGVCPCSTAATATGAATSCTIVTGTGPTEKRCKGNRSCGTDGLSECVLVTGDAASCVQTQCLDPITLQPLADGALCDDGRACTKGDACKAGICVSGTSICPCEPGFADCPADTDATNLCRGALYCAATPDAETAYSCLPNPGKTKVCDASLDTPCSKNACVPLAGTCTPTATERTVTICDLPPPAEGKEPGCRVEVLPADAPSAAAASCDDGLPCTTGDACQGGSCSPASTNGCGCQGDADCPDDGDLCNGVPFCDKSGSTWSCKLNPATVVTCDTSTDDACTKTSCQPQDGSCKKAGKPAGTACDDGVACTTGDICDGKGGCTPGTWTCCKSDVDCAKEEDGDLCNGTLFCNLQNGACELNPATVVKCPTVDDTACSQAQCQKASGKCVQTPVNIGNKCSDGNACSDLDTCDDKGQCKPGKDVCPCKIDADCVQYDDGDFCNGTLYCNPIAGPDGTGVCRPNPKSVVVCKTVDDTACRKTSCEKKTGACKAVDLPPTTACDADGTACTTSDSCDGKGTCVPGTLVCVCQTDADCAAKEDGDLCNGTLYCDKTSPGGPACVVNPATLKSCPSVDDTACQKNLCQPKTGACAVTPLPLAAPCDDGEACTGGDGCDGKGACKAGAASLCGCKTDPDCAVFDDGDVCNGGFACKAGACEADNKPLQCDDGNACTDDSCDSKTGCSSSANTLPCEDGDACSGPDVCAGASCKAGPANTCDDGNPCTDDSCDPKSGCANVANVDPCDDGDACTTGEICTNKACAGGAVNGCDDTNPCTDDACDSKTGCSHTANTASCDDGDACTVGDACGNKACVSGVGALCDDGNPCTVDSCVQSSGCTAVPAAEMKICATGPIKACKSSSCVLPCGTGTEAVEVDVDGVKMAACSALAPIWGQRPDSPAGVYSTKTVGTETVVLDSQTKLVWQQGQAAEGLTPADAKTYCDGLEFAGEKDWRLPSVHELASIVDYSVGWPGPTVDKNVFGSTKNTRYWTSTVRAGSSPDVWRVDFDTGGINSWSPDGKFQVRCVRGGGTGLQGARFSLNADKTVVTDALTALQWTRSMVASSKDWTEAKGACTALSLDGSGWRLPTLRELHGLVDTAKDQPAIDGTMFPAATAGQTWTSLGRAGSTTEAWYVNFSIGNAFYTETTGTGNVRCVR